MNERSSVGAVINRRDRGFSRIGDPAELYLSVCWLMQISGASRQKLGAPGAAPPGGNELGSEEEQRIPVQPGFKPLARQSALFGCAAKPFLLRGSDRAGLRTAWKYSHLFHEARLLTCYIEWWTTLSGNATERQRICPGCGQRGFWSD